MSLPTGTPTEFKVAVVEKKRDLEPKGDMPAKVILKLGLVHGEEKAWAEMFESVNESSWPKPNTTETLILTQPDNPEWALKARRPGKGGGGGRGRSPQETKRIERMAAHKTAAAILGPIKEGQALDGYLADFKMVADELVADLP